MSRSKHCETFYRVYIGRMCAGYLAKYIFGGSIEFGDGKSERY